MIQATSKRPFGHPVPAGVVDYYLHPREGHALSEAAWGRDGKLYAANGWVALRFFGLPPELGTGKQEVVDRLRRLPWHSPRYEDATAWRRMDDCTLDIFKGGVIEPWSVERLAYRTDPCVRINVGTLVPCVSLQMISRLPRCEVYTVLDRSQPVPFRFNGGEGLLARLTDKAESVAAPAMAHIFARNKH